MSIIHHIKKQSNEHDQDDSQLMEAIEKGRFGKHLKKARKELEKLEK